MKINNPADLQHFYTRLGFGLNPTTLQQQQDKNSTLLLHDLLTAKPAVSVAPEFVTPLSKAIAPRKADKETRRHLRQQRRQQNNQLTRWWLERLHRTSQPLQERMTLFWHNHFTTSARSVNWPQLIFRQHALLHQHALGNFADLLKAIYLDPAMLFYLDGRRNVAQKPNENFARELLELFTLGEGHYSEADVLQAARAFTGWRYNIRRDEVLFSRKRHDQGEKTFLGQRGHFNGDDIIRILLDSPRTAEFIAEKFWQHFINTAPPDPAYIKHWALLFRESGYEIKILLSAVVNSEVFWAKANRGTLIKSPVEYTIALLRELQIDDFDNYKQLANFNNRLGQRLFYPPDVKGWRGGQAWLDNTTFVLRQQFARRLLRGFSPKHKLASLEGVLLPLPAVNPKPKKAAAEEALLALVADPVYQLR